MSMALPSADREEGRDGGGVSAARVRWLSATALQEAAALWRSLEAQAPVGVVGSWTWTVSWLRHFGDVVAPRFAVVEDGGRTIAAMLVVATARRRAGLPLRVVHLGTRGEPRPHVYTEQQRLLIVPGERETAVRALAAELRRLPWDELWAESFVAEDAALLQAALPGAWTDPLRCRVLALKSPDVVTGLGSSSRKVARRSIRRAAPLEMTWLEEPAEIATALEQLAALQGHRWAAEPGPPALSGRVLAFLHDVTPRLAAEGRIGFVRVDDAQGIVGCELALDDLDGRVLAYALGRREQPHGRWSAGLVTELLTMQACADHGRTLWSHLSGVDPQKERLSDGEELLLDLRWRRGRARLLDVGRAVRHAVRRTRA
jgi:hypothetical protein